MGEEQAVDRNRVEVGEAPEDELVEAELEIAQFGEPGAADGELAAGLAAQLEQLAAQRDEYLALAQRTQADFENYRKRVMRDAGAAELRGVGRLARELLPALDNLERALD